MAPKTTFHFWETRWRIPSTNRCGAGHHGGGASRSADASELAERGENNPVEDWLERHVGDLEHCNTAVAQLQDPAASTRRYIAHRLCEFDQI